MPVGGRRRLRPIDPRRGLDLLYTEGDAGTSTRFGCRGATNLWGPRGAAAHEVQVVISARGLVRPGRDSGAVQGVLFVFPIRGGGRWGG